MEIIVMIKKIIKLLGCTLGLGFTLYFVSTFWLMLFRETYTFTIHTNLYNEFWFEFFFFNISLILIVIAIMYLIFDLSNKRNKEKESVILTTKEKELL